MASDASFPRYMSSTFRPFVAIRYVGLTVLLLFILYQVGQHTSDGRFSKGYATTLTSATSSNGSSKGENHNEAHAETPISSPDHTGLDDSSAAYDFETPTTETSTHLYSRVGKVTSIWYEASSLTSQAYELALLSHKRHDETFGYKHFVQRRGAIEKLWSKHAYLIHLLVQELNKPPADRLDWLFWHDADVVLLNSLIPLEAFLPPMGDKWEHINLLISNDLGGLNDGTFFVRVCEWSVYFFAAGLSFPYYRPEVNLRFDEQSALQFLLEETKYRNNTLHVPQKWFNAYHHWGHDETVPPEWHYDYQENAPGDLLVHLPGAGNNRVGIINEYIEKVSPVGTERDKWNVAFNDTVYPKVIKEWWEKDAEREKTRQEEYWRRYHVLKHTGGQMDRERDAAVKKIKEDLAETGAADSEVEAKVKEYEVGWKKKKMEALREEELLRLAGTHEDYIKAD